VVTLNKSFSPVAFGLVTSARLDGAPVAISVV
jgi:hypothetical protein